MTEWSQHGSTTEALNELMRLMIDMRNDVVRLSRELEASGAPVTPLKTWRVGGWPKTGER